MQYIHIEQAPSCRSSGGVNSVITDLSQQMVQMGLDVHVISLHQRNGIFFEDQIQWGAKYGIKVAIMQRPGKTKLSSFISLRKYLKKEIRKDDVCLFLHLKWGVLAGVISSIGLRRISRIEVYHSGYINYKLQSFFCKRFINFHIAVSQEARNQLIQEFKVKPEKIAVVYNGVDVDAIRKIMSSGDHTDNRLMRYISVGRLSFEKGFIDSISAYTYLRKNNRIVNSEYIMIGDGNQLNEAKEISTGKVSFLGRIQRKDVFLELARSNVAVLPSLWEGNSILLLEVLSVGIPVIVSDIPSFQEVLRFDALEDDEDYRVFNCGIVFKKHNVDACVKALESFYNLPNDTKILMGKEVNSLAENYSLKKQAHSYMSIAEKVSKTKNIEIIQ